MLNNSTDRMIKAWDEYTGDGIPSHFDVFKSSWTTQEEFWTAMLRRDTLIWQERIKSLEKQLDLSSTQDCPLCKTECEIISNHRGQFLYCYKCEKIVSELLPTKCPPKDLKKSKKWVDDLYDSIPDSLKSPISTACSSKKTSGPIKPVRNNNKKHPLPTSIFIKNK